MKWTEERCQMLIPVYRATYHHRGKPYEVVMNGCTGMDDGTRPWDPIIDTLVLAVMIAIPSGIIAALVWLVGAMM